MKHTNKLLLLSIFSLIAVSTVGAATDKPPTQRPHNIYGTLTEVDTGNQLQGYTVQVLGDSGSVLASGETNSDGFYDLYVSATQGDSLTVEVKDGDDSKTLSYSSGRVSEVDLEFDVDNESSDNSNNQNSGSSGSGGSGGSGGGGLLPGQGGQNQQNQSQRPEPKSVSAQVSGDRATANVGQVKANQTVEVSIPDQASKNAVESVSFNAAQGSDSVEVVVRELQEKPDSVEDAGTEVYRYKEINVSGVTDEEISSADITFRVNKSFLDSRQRTVEDVVLKRFNDQSWEELPTRFSEETENAYRFVANSDGFSYYAIALSDRQSEQPDEQQPDQPQNETGTNETDGTDQKEKDGFGVLPWIAGLLVIVAGLAVYFRNQVTGFLVDLMPGEETSAAGDESVEEQEQESDESSEDSDQEED